MSIEIPAAPEHFNLTHIFECGQCFRWDSRPDLSYTGVALGMAVNISYNDGMVMIDDGRHSDFDSDAANMWAEYLDLSRDYGQIKKSLIEPESGKRDDIMAKATEFAHGIRILRQDPWESLISFIISANNSIPRIKRSIRLMSEKYGRPVSLGDEVYYTFPTPEALCAAGQQLSECGIGFRVKYVLAAAQAVCDGLIDLDGLKALSTADARQQLIKLKGVGEKISDCVMLFSLQKYDAFPIDVWVKRVMEYFYTPEASIKQISDFATQKFGDMAGFAQQYLFYYARELKIKSAPAENVS